MSDKTFSEAAQSYLENGGELKYLKRIIEYFEGKLLKEIVPFDIRQMALSLYPEDTHSGSTRNRCALSPARAVILHAYDRGWCNLMRLKRFKQEKPKRKEPARTAMDAGDWKSESIFIGTYVHSENASRTLADTFNKIRFDISV